MSQGTKPILPPLEIDVTGISTIHRHAERGFMSITVKSEGSLQETVSEEVTSTTNRLQQMFKALAPKTATGEPAPDAQVTVFSIGSIRSWSEIPYDRNDNPRPREYHASSSFEVIFRDLDKLGETASLLFAMPHVEITSIQWRLTDETRTSLMTQSRKEAMLDAIQRARDYAEVVGREVVPVEICDDSMDYSVSTRTRQTARRSTGGSARNSPNSLALEPEDVRVYLSVRVKFTTVD